MELAEPSESAPDVIDLTGLSDSSDSSNEGDQNDDDDDDDETASQRSSDSSSSGVEITLDETSRARLHEAISTVGEERLRQIVHTLANTIPAAEEALILELITLKRKTEGVILRWEICGNCGEEYDVGKGREEEECSFHPGDVEVDEDGFADWDELCHGPMDTAENRRSYPENFTWTCCDQNSMGEGCVRGEHRAAVARKKRRI